MLNIKEISLKSPANIAKANTYLKLAKTITLIRFTSLVFGASTFLVLLLLLNEKSRYSIAKMGLLALWIDQK